MILLYGAAPAVRPIARYSLAYVSIKWPKSRLTGVEQHIPR
jgi:hypothetical protein